MTSNNTTEVMNNNNKQNSSGIILPDELNHNNMKISQPRKKKGSNKINSYLTQMDGTMGYFETYTLRAPFGVSKYIPEGGSVPEYSLTLVCPSDEDVSKFNPNPKDVQKWFNEIKGLDELLIDVGVKNSAVIFGKEKKKEIVEELFKGMFKADKDGLYQPKIQPKIQKMREDREDPKDKTKTVSVQIEKPNVKVYLMDQPTDENPDPEPESTPTEINSFEELMELVPKGSYVSAILQPKIWFVAGKFGYTLNVVQLLVRKQKKVKIEGFAFSKGKKSVQSKPSSQSQADSQQATSATTVAPAAPAPPVSKEYQQDSEDEGNGGEEVVEAGEEGEEVEDA